MINRDQVNQLVSDGLRRIDHYLNHCSAVAYQALRTHRIVNFIVYDQEPVLMQTGVQGLEKLSIFFDQLENIQYKPAEIANHRCLIDCLSKLTWPGLLIWYTDLDDASQTCELENICRLFKQSFEIVFYNCMTTETALLDNDIEQHCRSPYHKLSVLDLKQAWQNSRRLLHRAGIHMHSQ